MLRAIAGLVCLGASHACYKIIEAWILEHAVAHTMKPMEKLLIEYWTPLSIFLLGVWLLWPQIRSKLSAHVPSLSTQKPTKTDAATPSSSPEATQPAKAWPNPYNPLLIVDKEFRNKEVQIDWNRYLRCTFLNCTFKYNGETPLQIEGCKFVGSQMFASDVMAINGMVMLLYTMGILKDDFKLFDVPPENNIQKVVWKAESPPSRPESPT